MPFSRRSMGTIKLGLTPKLPSFRRMPESSDDVEKNTGIAQWHVV